MISKKTINAIEVCVFLGRPTPRRLRHHHRAVTQTRFVYLLP